MDIKNSKELAKIIALCRKNGIETCKIDDKSIEFTLGQAPGKFKRKSKVTDEAESQDEKPEVELSTEDKLFWSSAGFNVGEQ